MSSKDRFNYLRITLATLQEGLRGFSPEEVKVLLFDNSTEPLPAIVHEVPHLALLKQAPEWATLHSEGRYHYLVDEGFKHSTQPFLLHVDSDAVFHPGFVAAVHDLVRMYPEAEYASLFNTKQHPGRPMGSDYLGKSVVGLFGTLISRKLWERLTAPPYDKHTNWIERQLAAAVGDLVVVTKRSYIEHIGMTGFNHYPNGDIDRADNFLDA